MMADYETVVLILHKEDGRQVAKWLAKSNAVTWLIKNNTFSFKQDNRGKWLLTVRLAIGEKIFLSFGAVIKRVLKPSISNLSTELKDFSGFIMNEARFASGQLRKDLCKHKSLCNDAVGRIGFDSAKNEGWWGYSCSECKQFEEMNINESFANRNAWNEIMAKAIY